MDPKSAPPWRVIDAPSATPTGSVPEPTSLASRPVRLGLLVAGAGVSALIAFWLAISGTGHGAVAIDGALPFGSSASALAASSVAPVDLRVEVVGAIQRPGVYAVAAGARVGDVIVAAGGYDPRVDTARVETELNLAATVEDGDQIRVPSRDDPTAPVNTGAEPVPGASELVDLNAATASELEALPGIGPVTAEKIITAREEAPFASVEELRSRGILGEKTFDGLKDLVTAG